MAGAFHYIGGHPPPGERVAPHLNDHAHLGHGVRSGGDRNHPVVQQPGLEVESLAEGGEHGVHHPASGAFQSQGLAAAVDPHHRLRAGVGAAAYPQRLHPHRFRHFPAFHVDDGPQFPFVDFNLAVRHLLHLGEGRFELVLFQGNFHFGQGVGEPGPPRMFAQHDQAFRPHRFGVHNLVGLAVPQHAVLMDARLVGEGVAPHHRFVERHHVTGQPGHQPAGGHDLLGVGPHFHTEMILTGFDRHNHLLGGSVACPLPDAVDGPLNLTGPGVDGGQGVGHRQPQVVVAVGGDDHIVPPAGHLVVHPAQQLHVVFGGGEPHRVRDVDGGGPLLHRRPATGDHKVGVGAGGVLGGELHIVGVAAGPGHRLHHGGQHLLRRHAQHAFHMDGGGALKNVDAAAGGGSHRLVGPVDVVGHAPGQGGDHRAFHQAGDLPHAVKVAVGGGRESGFDHVHPQFGQLAGYGQFLVGGKGDAGGLFAVPQGGVEDDEAVLRHYRSPAGVRRRATGSFIPGFWGPGTASDSAGGPPPARYPSCVRPGAGTAGCPPRSGLRPSSCGRRNRP